VWSTVPTLCVRMMIRGLTVADAMAYYSYVFTFISHLPDIPKFGQEMYFYMHGEPSLPPSLYERLGYATLPYVNQSKLEYVLVAAMWAIVLASFNWSGPVRWRGPVGGALCAALAWTAAITLRNTSLYLNWSLNHPIPSRLLDLLLQSVISVVSAACQLVNWWMTKFPTVSKEIAEVRGIVKRNGENQAELQQKLTELETTVEQLTAALTIAYRRIDANERKEQTSSETSPMKMMM